MDELRNLIPKFCECIEIDRQKGYILVIKDTAGVSMQQNNKEKRVL